MTETTKEREILKTMRRVLASIIKDTTPPHKGLKHPLSDATIDEVRDCLGLISARERELAEPTGIKPERPYFADDPSAAQVISIDRLSRKKPGGEGGTE